MKKIASLSAGALTAKAHAMYGDVLGADVYREALSCRSIAELAAFLRDHTAYESVFGDLARVRIQRARFEALLRKYTMSRIASLAASEKALGGSLYKTLIMDYDAELLITCAEYLGSEGVGEFIQLVPAFYRENSELNTQALFRARNLDEMDAALDGTPYDRLLDGFRAGAPFSVRALELLVDESVNTRAEQLIRENYSSETRSALLENLRMRADMKTVESLYRMKTYYPDADARRTGVLSNTVTAFTPSERTALLECKDAAALTATLKRTVYGKQAALFADGVIEHKTNEALLRTWAHRLRYSTIPQIVLISFVGIQENEMNNLVHIAEGIRYGLPPEEIAAFLITREGVRASEP